jgi:hypothetical protein
MLQSSRLININIISNNSSSSSFSGSKSSNNHYNNESLLSLDRFILCRSF